MARLLVQNPFDIEDNPRRRGRRVGRRKARKSSRRRRRGAKRENPFAFGAKSRRSGRRRRKGGKRRSSGRTRRNPFGMGGLKSGLMGGAVKGASLFGGVWLIDFARQIVNRRLMPAGVQSNSTAQGGISMALGLGLAWVLRKFGGPLRPLAASMVAAGTYRALWQVVPGKFFGGPVAASTGLADGGGLGLGAFLTTDSLGAGADWSENELLGGYLTAGSEDMAMAPIG